MTPKVAFVTILLVSACSTDPLYCDERKECTDPQRPFCDLKGQYPASEGIGRTCIPDPFATGPDASPGQDSAVGCGGRECICEPDTFLRCEGDGAAVYCNHDGSHEVMVACEASCSEARGGCSCEPGTSTCEASTTVHCGDDGTVSNVEPCPLDCDDSGSRCLDVDPSNGLAPYLDQAVAAPALVLSDGAVIDAETGEISDGDGTRVNIASVLLDAPAGGVAVRVFVVSSLVVGDTRIPATEPSIAVALVSSGDVSVQGDIQIDSGHADCAAGDGIPELTAGQLGRCNGSGSGGGGLGTPGARGGNSNGLSGTLLPGGSGGGVAATDSLVPLRGGCSGGRIGLFRSLNDPPIGYGPGAPGGGALQLVSRTHIEIAAGFLDAGGEGARPGSCVVPGGGSGGGILLEAPEVVVLDGAGIVANGGGGGGACTAGAGEDGRRSVESASGGVCPGPDGDGGSGGSASAATDGESVGVNRSGGGGGGGVGRIRINTATYGFQRERGAVVSPEPSVGTIGVR